MILIDYEKNKHIGDKNSRVTRGYPQTRWVRVWAEFQTRHGYGFLMSINIFHGYGFGIAKPGGFVPIAISSIGCAALADHLCAATWPPKFQPHLPNKYDGTSNPLEFLQVYVTAIMAAGGNTAVMASYFHVALTRPARTWLMNLTPGSVYSWEELYARFTANFASAYEQHGVEAHLHVVRQEPGETLRAFISRFTKVRGTIPRISDASIITAF
jgi:hypothetical protein